MQRQHNRKQKRPRRSRMPQQVYETATNLEFGLTDFETKYPEDKHWKGARTDETLCQEVAQPLREISSLAFRKELDPEINAHPHNDPWQCHETVLEAMRLAYGIQDLVDAGRRTNKIDRQLCAQLFEEFEKVKKAVKASKERRLEKYRSAEENSSAASATTLGGKSGQGKLTSFRSAFDWPYFDVHKNDLLTVEEGSEVRIGQLIVVKTKTKPKGICAVRVCDVRGHRLRASHQNGETCDKDASMVLGAVVKVSHDGCVRAKIEALRERIYELETERDSWANATKVAALEKQIYDLEHPIAEKEDGFEWPEVIGDE